jgi:Spy/CpxP family protein refolding chaperone
MDRHNMEGPDRERPAERGPGGAMGIVPPGTWWKNPEIITALTLTADQQKKMDEIFRQNRIALIDVKASLEKEQINLEPLLNANPVDSAKAMAEISKIADLRAGLEKANAKMLLSLRSVLTAEQWTKLQDLQHSHRKGPGPDAQGPGRGKGGRGPGGQAGPPPPSN